MAGTPINEEAELWFTFDRFLGTLPRDYATHAGETAQWLRGNLVSAIVSGTWDGAKPSVHGCAERAAKVAVAIQPILNPHNAIVDEALFAAAVHAVKAHWDSSIHPEGVLCA